MVNRKNKVAFATGSAPGIGNAIAERFGALGGSVLVNYTVNRRPTWTPGESDITHCI